MEVNMSELLNRLKKEQLLARKAKDTVRASLLTTVIGEASPSGNQTVTDDDVQAKIGKFYKNLKDNRVIYLQRNQDITEVDQEMAILEEFLPRQLSEDDIRNVVTEYVSNNDLPQGNKAMGMVMGYLSKKYKGQYDGKVAKDVVLNVLNP